MSEDSSPENAGPEWRLKWSTLDVNQANGLLDKIGLTKKDPQGMRLRTDNGQVLRMEVTTVAASFLPYAQMMEMVAQQWKKIGIQLDIKDTERALSVTKVRNNEQQLYVWTAGDPDIFMWPRHDMPAEPNEPFSGTLYATWYASNGASGQEAGGSGAAQGVRPAPQGLRPGDRRAQQGRSGAQEGHCRPAVGDRHGRVHPGPADHQQQAGECAGSVHLARPRPDAGAAQPSTYFFKS